MVKKYGLALGLIALGVILLMGNLDLVSGEIVLLVISFVLFGAYFLSGSNKRMRNAGLLIPACIILMVGIFVVLDELHFLEELQGTLFFFFIGMAFFMVYFIHTVHLKSASFGERNWPAITGGALLAFSSLIFMVEYLDWQWAGKILNNIWPGALIVTGVLMILFNVFRKQKV